MFGQVCQSCNGQGWIKISKAPNLNDVDRAIIKAVGSEHVRKPCAFCNGKGKLYD